MSKSGLAAISRQDEHGRPHVKIVQNDRGEFVLSAPDEPLSASYRTLEGVDCMRLAVLQPDEPALVVESDDGDFVVLVDEPPNPERYTPLSLDDAEVLAGVNAPVARFGRRDDDMVQLTPWLPDEGVFTFDPDDDRFADVPLVRLQGDELLIERGELDGLLAPLVLRYFRDRGDEGGTLYGVFANPFGEFGCIPVGAPLELHEDLRNQAVVRGRSLMDGATTLTEAATALRAYADRLQAAEAQGWRLQAPVTDDYGFPERSE